MDAEERYFILNPAAVLTVSSRHVNRLNHRKHKTVKAAELQSFGPCERNVQTIISHRGWEAWFTPVYVQICSTISQVSQCTKYYGRQNLHQSKEHAQTVKMIHNNYNNNNIFKAHNLVPREYSKRIHMHTHTHARTHTNTHTQTHTHTHKHSDYTKL